MKNTVYEKVKQEKNIVDTDLLAELNKDDREITFKEMNKVLFKLEILGLVTVRWVGKDKRRVEVVEKPVPETFPEPEQQSLEQH